MPQQQLTDTDLITLLVSVGADSDLTAADLDAPFDDLHLDSLARAEVSARIRARYGVDVEERLTADTTPTEMRAMVSGALSTPADA